MTSVAADRRREVVWHDVECGAYAADLALWDRLADEAGGPILDLGCGTGRVTLHLARGGHRVTGLDSAGELVAELRRRAAMEELTSVSTTRGDARSLALEGRFELVIAPMQLLQILGGERERVACLRGVGAHLAPGGIAAVAIVTAVAETDPDLAPPLPDVREADGWVYSSLPLAVRRIGEGLVVGRLRQAVSPHGALSEERYQIELAELSLATLAAEAGKASLRLTSTLELAPSADHVGSTVAVLEAA